MNYFVYIVQCRDGSYYTGVTNNVDRRIAEHNLGIYKECYTYKRRPVEPVFSADFWEITDAIAFEKQLKGWSRKKKRAVIEGRWTDLPELSRCRTIQTLASFRLREVRRLAARRKPVPFDNGLRANAREPSFDNAAHARLLRTAAPRDLTPFDNGLRANAREPSFDSAARARLLRTAALRDLSPFDNGLRANARESAQPFDNGLRANAREPAQDDT